MTFKECKYLIKSDLNRLTKVKWGGGGGGGKKTNFKSIFTQNIFGDKLQDINPPKKSKN